MKLWDKLLAECKDANFSEGQIIYARQITREYNADYIDDKHDGSENRSELRLENLNFELNKRLSDEDFEKLKNNTNDAIPKLADYDLTYEQRSTFSPTEKKEWYEERKKKASQLKAFAHNVDASIDGNMELDGIKTQEDEDKQSTKMPDPGLWGDSEYYRYNFMLGDYFDTLGKYFHDYAKTVYVFKPDPEINKQALDLIQKWLDNRGIPMSMIALIQAKDGMNILDNIQDEKNRDSFLGWLKKSVDKFWEYGNHGTGEVDYILTGEHIAKLAPDNKTIIRIPIKREFTREQVGDKTTVELDERQNQVFVTCPECGLKFNKPIIPDEQRDLFAGEFFYKAGCATLANDLSNSIEEYSKSVLFVEKKTPLQFINEQLKKRGLKEVTFEPKVVESKPEKIKEVDIDEDNKLVEAYNCWYGRAHRTQFKAEHFSDQA